ncbi:MAG TPA: phage integrase SAM-like domain-containing protein [Mucilaginibacter sp.]
MAETRHKVVFIKDHYKVKDPVSGEFKPAETSTLYIRSYQPKGETQHKKISLEIRLKNNDVKSFWDSSRQRFKDIKKNPNAQEWNDKIESELKKVVSYKDLTNVPQKRKSFLKYWDSIIDTTTNHGTRIKHDGVKKKLQKYLGVGIDLYFSEITPELVRSIYHNFKTAKNPKRLKISTANHYMNMIHGVINTAVESRYYNYDIDPFIGLKYDKAEEPILEGKVIDSRSMRHLLNDRMQYESERNADGEYSIKPLPKYLEKYRLAWVYQFLCNKFPCNIEVFLRTRHIT